MKIDQKTLKETVEYNYETGVFTWKVSNNPKIKIGSIAGTNHNKGYMSVSINHKKYLVHRLVWLYVYGKWPKDQIDHINHNKKDNRILNLREATNEINQKNKSMYSNNTSGVTGVSWYSRLNKWRARITINGNLQHLGYFDYLDDAIVARLEAKNNNNYHLNHGTQL